MALIDVSDAQVARVAEALAAAAGRAFTIPIVYPWSVQHFVERPEAERPRPAAGRHRLYVHIPFCRYHCTFCFYAVRTGAALSEMERYVDALGRELEWLPEGCSIERLVVGGGTPTALPPPLLDRVLRAVFERAAASEQSAHTLEASPDSLTGAHLDVLRAHGVGRVSIGIESLDDAVLDTVHRRHTPAQALAACREVSEGGLSLNVDLIYGLPSQTEDGFRRDLETIAETGADSLCLYGLRLNERTAVASQLDPSERLDLGRVMRWRAFVAQAAEACGFVQTRPYTFKRAATGRAWHERSATFEQGGADLAVGMSARAQIGGAVYRNHDRNDVYMERIERGVSPVQAVFELDAEDLRTQTIARTLGNDRPLDRRAYAAIAGASIDDHFGGTLDRLRLAGLIDDDGTSVRLTDVGRLVYDRVLQCFYPERARGWLAAQPATLRRERPAST
jgi:oxygen-independent coproporphyrinogen-3 oxidase